MLNSKKDSPFGRGLDSSRISAVWSLADSIPAGTIQIKEKENGQ